MRRADLIIEDGMILTMKGDLKPLIGYSVVVKGDSIEALGPKEQIQGIYSAQQVISAKDSLVLPGLINGHTHGPMTIFRGLADDMPLMEWLEKYIFPVESNLRAEWVRCGALLACAEMLLAGTTTFCDMYLFEREVAKAAKEAGIRAIVGEVLYDFPSPNYGPWEKGLKYTEELILEWMDDPLIKVAVEPHAPFTCSPDLLRRCRELANRYEVPLMIHLSETRDEVNRVKDTYGLTPIRHLANLGIFDGPTVADHVVWADDEELDSLAHHAVGVIHNPESNMKLASGVARVEQMIKRGIKVGLGTDGAASNNDLDLMREMDTAAKLHKAKAMDPTVLDSKTVLRMATCMGAEALGIQGIVGTLEPGKRADLIILDLKGPHMTPVHDILSQIVYCARGSDVRTVIVNGQVAVKERELIKVDVKRIVEEAQEISKDVMRVVRKSS